jgi:hypothetical protein
MFQLLMAAGWRGEDRFFRAIEDGATRNVT